MMSLLSRRGSWRAASPLGVLCACVLAGCQMGPGALKVANTHYSDAVRVSQEEQMLVNLVRLRYRDQPTFLSVSNISTQFEFGAVGSVGGTIKEGGGNDSLGLGAGIEYSERPTISFSIMGGQEFLEQMLAPLDLAAVARLAESGWRGDRVFRITAEGLNGIDNAPQASGPTPTTAPPFRDFLEATRLLRTLSQQRLIGFEYETRRESVSDPISLSRLEAADLVNAARAGAEFELGHNETATLVVERRRLVLRLARGADASPDVARLRALLKLDPSLNRFDVVDIEDSSYDPLEPDRPLAELGMDTRSLMGVLYYLSHAVEPPQEHIDAGVVTSTVDGEGNPFEWREVLDGLFRVRSSSQRPKTASVAVRHRGHWFYIDDSDETSKSTFLLLGQIFMLQAGDVEEVKPVLTLPVG